MGYVKTQGIIIREVNTGEADKMLTILTRNNGKISGYAKGARRSRSRLLAGTQFLCYSDMVLFKGRELYQVSSCDIIEPFYEIRNDIIKLTYAAHMVDIINDVIQEGQSSAKVLRLFLNALHMLAKSDKPTELIVRVFELRFLSILGFTPRIRCCMECGELEFSNLMFSFKDCGFICGSCGNTDGSAVELSPGAARAIHHVVTSGMDDLFRFNLSEDVLEELGRVVRRYLRDRLEKDYTKLNFLNKVDI